MDAIFIGPGDLAASMGFAGRPSAEPVQQAINDALRRITAAGCAAGVLSYGVEPALAAFDQGAGFVAIGADTWLLARESSALVGKLAALMASADDQCLV